MKDITKKILIYLYAFYLIYTPSFQILGNYSSYIILLISLIIFLSIYWFKKDNGIIKMLYRKEVKIFIIITFLASIYFAIRAISYGVAVNNIINLRLIQSNFPVIYLLHCIILIDQLNKQKYCGESIIKFFINIGIIQSIICVLMAFSSTLHNIALYIYYLDRPYNVFVSATRIFGFTSDYTFGLQITTGLFAGFLFIYAFLNKKNKLYFYIPIILIATVLNGRLGIIIFFLSFFILLIFSFKDKEKLKRIAKMGIILFIMFLCLLFILRIININGYNFVIWAINDTINLFIKGEFGGNYQILLKEMLFFPRKIFSMIFGIGARVIGKQGVLLGYPSSDIGYVNDMFMGGIIYCLLLYVPLSKYILSKYKNKLSKYSMLNKTVSVYLLISFLIINFKGEVMRNAPILISIFLIKTILLNYESENKEKNLVKENIMNKENIKFSIIVPAYNIKDYIERCLNSILSQNYKNFEIIIVNDGSTDNCEKICKKYAKKDARIKYILKENGGLSSARNEGIKYATGDYIWFVDGDDYIKEESLNIISKVINNNIEINIICFKNYIDRDGIITPNNIFRQNIDVSKQYMLNQTSAWNKVFKRKFLNEHNFEFPLGIIYEDLAVLPSLCIYTSKIIFLDEYLYYYVVRTNSIMHVKKFKENRDNKFIAIDKLINIFKKQKSFQKYKPELEFLCIKHLLITYSTEILKYNSDIYKNRIKRAINYVNQNFPNYQENKYFVKEPLITRFFCKSLQNERYTICKTILYAARILKRID